MCTYYSKYKLLSLSVSQSLQKHQQRERRAEGRYATCSPHPLFRPQLHQGETVTFNLTNDLT